MSRSTYRFAERTGNMSASIIREILKVSSRAGVISFAGGLPAAATFPLKAFERAVRAAIRIDGTRALQYMVTEGHAGLKAYLCGWLKSQGISAKPEAMLMTQGSQQALDLLGKVFLSPGDKIIVEDPSYLGAIQAFNAYQARYVTVPIDDAGMRPDRLEAALKRHRVKFIYTVPTFHNPAGTTIPLERRLALLRLAGRYGVPIIEDDPYSVLRFRGKAVPSLYELAKGKGVVYLSTFSKILSPGIRLGFAVAEEKVLRQLLFAKQASDLQTNTFIQYAIYHYCRAGSLESHLPAIIRDYDRRAGVMMSAIRSSFPAKVHVVEPDGGMFIWCTLPKPLTAARVFEKSIRQNVAFVDGSVFHANGGGRETFRLNFTNSTDADIKKGIRVLGGVIRSLL